MGEEERSGGMGGEAGRSRRQEGAPSLPCPHLQSYRRLSRQPEQDSGASCCHDEGPLRRGPCAPVDVEDHTLLGSHTETWLHTLDPSHRGPPTPSCMNTPCMEIRLEAQRGRGGRAGSLVLVSQVPGQRTDRRPPIPCHLPVTLTASRQEEQSQPPPQQSGLGIRNRGQGPSSQCPRRQGQLGQVMKARVWLTSGPRLRLAPSSPRLTPRAAPGFSGLCLTATPGALTVSGGGTQCPGLLGPPSAPRLMTTQPLLAPAS